MLLEHLPHLMTVKRKSYTQDEDAGDRESLTAYATGVPCWIQPAGRSEMEIASRRQQRVTHSIYHVQALDLREDDEVVPEDGPYAGRRLKVKWFGEATVGLDYCQQISCEEFVR